MPNVRFLLAATLLGAWVGAALLAAASVAPAAFRVLPTRALAGALVGQVLPAVFVSGIVVGVAAALLSWDGGPLARTRTALPLAVAVACAVAQFVITPRIERVRATIGPDIEALAKTDPRRVEFGRLHGISVAWMGLGLLAAAGGLAATILAARERAP